MQTGAGESQHLYSWTLFSNELFYVTLQIITIVSKPPDQPKNKHIKYLIWYIYWVILLKLCQLSMYKSYSKLKIV